MSDTLKHLTHAQIHPSPNNLRSSVGDVSELAASIAGIGLQQAMLVRKNGDGFELIAGERRWTAIGQLIASTDHPEFTADTTWPTIVRTGVDDAQQTAAMIVENLHRAGLTPIEEMAGFLRLANDHGYTADQIATATGIPASTVKARLKWAKLPDPVLARILSGTMQIGVANRLAAKTEAEIVELVGKKGTNPLTEWDLESFDRKKRTRAEANAAQKMIEKAGHVVMTTGDFDYLVKNPPTEGVFHDMVVASQVDGFQLDYRNVATDKKVLQEYLVDVAPVAIFTLDIAQYGGVNLRHRIVKAIGAVEADDEPDTEYERDCRLADEQHEQAVEEWRAAVDAAERQFLDGKPAELIAWVLQNLISTGNFSYYVEHNSAEVRKILALADDDVSLLEYSTKGAREIARLAAALQLRHSYTIHKVPGVELERPVAIYPNLDHYDEDGNRYPDDVIAANAAQAEQLAAAGVDAAAEEELVDELVAEDLDDVE